MKGYIYITSPGTDPIIGQPLNDPIFAPVPTLGACMPNIRAWVEAGDWIFCVSGMTHGVQQYVVGGLEVAEKIDALAALKRYPEYAVRIAETGEKYGNIIVQPDGKQNPADDHEKFEYRIKNYIVGGRSVQISGEAPVERARRETLIKLQDLFGRAGNRPIDVLGRCRKMTDTQVYNLLEWLETIQ